MYMDKQVKRGYNEYIRLDEGIGKDAMMDVALLVMEDGDTWSCEEPEKEVAALVFDGKCTIKWENESYDVDRPNPFDYNPSCLHVCKGVKFEIIAHGPCNIYIQKTLNEKTFPSKMYKPEDTDTWARGNKGELMGCTKRDVRTCFDLDNAPYSNMVLGEVVNLPGKWSSYPPHHHPQPEVYFYRFDHPSGFGAGWGDGELYETHHNGLALITKGMHPQVTAPGYTCCYAWGIRHLPGNPWDKTRIDDEEHLWEILSEALGEAAKQFVESRQIEGENLKRDLLGKLDYMDSLVDYIGERSPQILAEYRAKLEEKVKELLAVAAIDESRIAAEVTIYADKICVDEEMVRLKSHIEATRAELLAGGSVGRKLDFIAQEMNREANTILSKSTDLAIADKAIALKTEIEKVREQIQNIE